MVAFRGCKKTLYLKATREKREEEIETLSLNEIYPFLSTSHSPLVKEVDRSIRNLLAILRYSYTVGQGEKIDIKMDLVQFPDGQRFPVEFTLIESTDFDTGETIISEIELPYVEPDLYTLEVTLSLVGFNIKEVVSRTFRIR